MDRKSLTLSLVVLALVVVPAAFASDEPAVPLSQEELISTLQEQAGAGDEMPELEGSTPAPLFKHGEFCSYQGQGCRSCILPNGSSGKRSCEIQQCYYNGQPHNHFVNCGNCTTACPI